MKTGSKITAAALALSMAFASGCSQTVTTSADTSAPTSVSVSGYTVAQQSISRETAYSGRVMPGESVYVISKVQGTVSDTYFDVGDYVKEGEVLFAIDPVDVMLTVNQAKTAYEAAEASVNQALGSGMDANVISAQSSYKQAKLAYQSAEDAANKISRYIKTMEEYSEELDDDSITNERINAIGEEVEAEDPTNRESVSAAVAAKIAQLQASYDEADMGYEQAELAYKAARSAYRLVEGAASDEAAAVANANLAQAKAAYDAALAQLNYCKVTSPISGVVEMKNVSENGFAASSSAAYVISNKDVMSVTFGVPADVSRSLEIGDVVKVENGSIEYEAKIVEIGTMIDSTSGLFKVKANIENAGADLLSGIAVKLTAVTAHSDDALVIPTDAIYYDDGSAYVYIVSDGIAVKTMITTGIISGTSAEVVDGVDEGDVVITSWSANLRDGAAVSVQEG